MKEIECSKAITVSYMPGAADECEMVLRYLGFQFVRVKGTRGSHGAEIRVSEKERAEFDEKVLHTTVHGKYRSFFISSGVQFGVHYYYVSYRKRKYEKLTPDEIRWNQ